MIIISMDSDRCSVINALNDVTSLTYDQIQNKAYISLLLIDLCKAFKTVLHKILLQNYIIMEYEALVMI